jgi:hypothetical protein
MLKMECKFLYGECINEFVLTVAQWDDLNRTNWLSLSKSLLGEGVDPRSPAAMFKA